MFHKFTPTYPRIDGDFSRTDFSRDVLLRAPYWFTSRVWSSSAKLKPTFVSLICCSKDVKKKKLFFIISVHARDTRSKSPSKQHDRIYGGQRDRERILKSPLGNHNTASTHRNTLYARRFSILFIFFLSPPIRVPVRVRIFSIAILYESIPGGHCDDRGGLYR